MNPNEASANKTFNITTNGVTLIPIPANPIGKLVLVRLIINKKGASSNVATIYDTNLTLGENTDYKKGTVDTTDKVTSIECGYVFYNGIYIKTETGTAPDITVVYKEIA